MQRYNYAAPSSAVTYAAPTSSYRSAAATYTAAPQVTYAAPSAPVTYSSPVSTYAAPSTYARPVTTYAAPQVSYRAPTTYAAPTTVTYAAPAQYTTYAAPQTVTYGAPEQYVEKKGNFKVCVCGGSGGIGQPLSLLMATDPNCGELSIYDLSVAMVPPQGVAADLAHLEKKVKVSGYVKTLEEKAIDVLGDCLAGCDLVLVPAGVPRKPGQTRDDLFKINAGIAKEVVEACARYCPNAIVALIVNPVNSVVPAMGELYRKAGLDPRKIVGVTTLDCVRANKFVAELTGADPDDVDVPVIGGHAGVTIMPVFSQDQFARMIPQDQIPELDAHVQNAGTEVVNAKNGKGSATLSMAYSGARLGKAVLAGLNGTPTTECAYVLSDVVEGIPYFTSKVTFGPSGVEEVHHYGDLNEYEQQRLAEACEALMGEINSGLEYADANNLCE